MRFQNTVRFNKYCKVSPFQTFFSSLKACVISLYQMQHKSYSQNPGCQQDQQSLSNTEIHDTPYKIQDSPKQGKVHCPKMYLTWLWKQEFRKTLGHPTPSCLTGGAGDGKRGRNVVEGLEIETNRGIKVGGGGTNSMGHPPTVHSNVKLPKPQVWDSFKRVFGKWQLRHRQHVGVPGE